MLKILSIQKFCTNNVGVGTIVDGGFAEYVIIDVNCNRDCPFKVAFGEGQSLWPHNCTGSTPISGVIGVGVKSNGKHPAGKESLPLRQRERARGDTFMSKNKEKWKKGEQYEGEIAENP